MLEPIEYLKLMETRIPLYYTQALIIGSGSASLACALRLKKDGIQDLLIVTDNSRGGTSRNTGSDKQTYYKLSDSSPEPDSPYDMAASLTQGGAMHGDLALIEALGSTRAFYNLVAIGVPFPFNQYGGYTGYKTDHDPKNRGISLGPYTSRNMVEKLYAEVQKEAIPFWDNHDVIKLLKVDNRVVGALVMDKHNMTASSFGLSIVLADNVVLGTGGPAGFYAASVYPRVHTGGIGLALELGAQAVNLTESQFGIASTKFRWNLSGSYQQVLPCYYSTDRNGEDRQNFLLPYFSSWEELTRAVFLKGYQWPFNADKICGKGSSLIDLLIFIEIEKRGRRVFIDFRENLMGNPSWGPFSRNCVWSTALEYIENSSSWAESPLQRLQLMNPAALAHYREHAIDLAKEPLEINLCAQHNNGGLAADIWWESTNIKRLFPIGEVNGSHGVSRPGGTALNSGQVGAIRAAAKIVFYGKRDALVVSEVLPAIEQSVAGMYSLMQAITADYAECTTYKSGDQQRAKQHADRLRTDLQKRMSHAGGPIRDPETVTHAVKEASELVKKGLSGITATREQLPLLLKIRHMIIAHYCYLKAIEGYISHGGGSRGSYVILSQEGETLHALLGDDYTIKPENTDMRKVIQVIEFSPPPDSGDSEDNEIDLMRESYIPCRSIPAEEHWFEQVWSNFVSGNIFNT